ncbi:MAG: GntR family transcriptional regulator [Lachnospiraceae bacterium]|nr:GntR family transcriptional regulator [Lachnospiraceae bacterium]
MNINIQPKSSVPIYEQIENQMKEEILAKRLREGEALPSIRSLARDLKISVITTKRAYEELEKEGLIYSVAGKGFYVDSPDTGYLAEKRVQGVEERMEEVLKLCKKAELSKEEVKDMIDILWEDMGC